MHWVQILENQYAPQEDNKMIRLTGNNGWDEALDRMLEEYDPDL